MENKSKFELSIEQGNSFCNSASEVKEIAKGVKKCPHCGKDQRNFFGKHKIITVILALIIIGGVGSALGGNNTKPSSNSTKVATDKQNVSSTDSAKTTTNETPKVKKYTTGTYLVNKDIPSGLYKVIFC